MRSISTLIFGSLFVESVDSTKPQKVGISMACRRKHQHRLRNGLGDPTDTDDDGLPDVLEESQYGTDPEDPDTDNDGMSDGWEVDHGLNPLDGGETEEAEEESGSTQKQTMLKLATKVTHGQTTQGKFGDPDNDGLTNEREAELETDPQRVIPTTMD